MLSTVQKSGEQLRRKSVNISSSLTQSETPLFELIFSLIRPELSKTLHTRFVALCISYIFCVYIQVRCLTAVVHHRRPSSGHPLSTRIPPVDLYYRLESTGLIPGA